mgnify:CR=1 FL=1
MDEVRYVGDLGEALAGAGQLFLLKGKNSDSGEFTAPADLDAAGAGQLAQTLAVDTERLHPVLSECRVFKSPEEVELLEFASRVSSEAHVAVMRACRPGIMEYQLESTFLHHCYFHGGCRLSSYTSICATGKNGAVLHYGHAGAPNDAEVRDGDMVLCDMGGEYHGYAADITCTFPANGKFTPVQAAIYNGVLDAHQAVLQAVRPGVAWPEMHRLAETKILGALVKAGFLRGDVGSMMEARLGGVFMPHGLGHLLGIDTHDVGGYREGDPAVPPRPVGPGISKIRTARVLAPGMMMTVEPGCYFCEYLLRKAFDGTGLLPDSVLWRRKCAFSDGVSTNQKSWHHIIQEHVDGFISDEDFRVSAGGYDHCQPQLKESLYYRRVFESLFEPSAYQLIPHFWLPRWSNVIDPSARELAEYEESTIEQKKQTA